MEAISKTGKILHGKIAEILVRKGSATLLEDPDELALKEKQKEEARLLKEQKDADLKAAKEKKLKDQEEKANLKKAAAEAKIAKDKAKAETEKVKLIKSGLTGRIVKTATIRKVKK